MREKELRIALVCYGGLSLAVYMHGVTKEIQKLARASKIFHSPKAKRAEVDAGYDDVNDDSDRETDTESVYFDLLRRVGRQIDLRVIVDVIAGASAGGINGVMLARALAHDLPLDAHRAMWLECADVLELMEPAAIPGAWRKLYARPLLWGFTRSIMKNDSEDSEIRSKLSRFVRTRWFQPPFSGRRFTAMLLGAMTNMGKVRQGASLLPPGHRLSLLVTLTNFHGFDQTVRLFDPPRIHEREHRHLLEFSCLQTRAGDVSSDFDDEGVPGLAFAARATSSYAGLFAPFRFDELDDVLSTRGKHWKARDAFIEKHFESLIDAGENPTSANFVDGGILDNKPFGAAIKAIRGRPAHRQVDRRIVYLEPDPDRGERDQDLETPGFFDALRGAFSAIPRHQPIRDDLERLMEANSRTRLVRNIIDSVRPHVNRLLEIVFVHLPECQTDAEQIARWREIANQKAATEAGYAYECYVRAKLFSMVESLASLLCSIRIGQKWNRSDLIDALEQWIGRTYPLPKDLTKRAGDESESHWIDFLRRFDLDFRVRRLRFVIIRANELYRNSKSDASALNRTKRVLYDNLEILTSGYHGSRYSPGLRADVNKLHLGASAEADAGVLDEIFRRLADELDLPKLDETVDEAFASLCGEGLPQDVREELLLAYVGFSFFDVLTYPIARSSDLEELDETKVVRLSPDEATGIRPGGAEATLKGVRLNNFGGFFSRRIRENDYLWGRLHAAERLVDIVLSAAEIDPATTEVDVAAVKRELFLAILTTESPHLGSIADEVRMIRSEIASGASVTSRQS